MLGKAMAVAGKLRKVGKSVCLYQEVAKKVGKAFNYADRVKARYIAFVAPDEWSRGMVRVKDLRTDNESAKERDVPLDALDTLEAIFAAPTNIPAK